MNYSKDFQKIPPINPLTLSGRLGHSHLADMFYSGEIGEKGRPEGIKGPIATLSNIHIENLPNTPSRIHPILQKLF